MENEIDLTIPCTKKSISAKITDFFESNNLTIFGPTSKSSEFILNKATLKKTLYKLRIPTPKFGIFEKQNMAVDYIKNFKSPFVIKTNDSGSAVIITSQKTAKNVAETS